LSVPLVGKTAAGSYARRRGVQIMTEDEFIREILKKYRNIAVYGISENPEKPAHSVPAYLLSKGYNIIPVNPYADKIIGRKSYPDLKEIEERIDIVEVFRPSADVVNVVKQALARKKERGDIAVIWLQEGIRNEEARELAEEMGVVFIQDRCMRKEFKRLFPERAEG
jgi:predicted CoA-binding protein